MSLSASSEERELFGECWKNLTRKQRVKVFANSSLRTFERLNEVVNSDWDDFNSDNQVRLIISMSDLGDVCFK